MMGLKHQAATARKWRTAIRRVEQHFPRRLPPALFLTDPARVPDPVSAIADLPARTGVIYRHFGAGNRFALAEQLAQACRSDGRTLLIAADPKLALAIGADGVHWPEARRASARKWRGRFSLQTTSAHSRQALIVAARSGFDAALLSPVFPSNSPSATRAIGARAFRTLSRAASLSVYALGGVNSQNLQRVAPTGGLAAIDGMVIDGMLS